MRFDEDGKPTMSVDGWPIVSAPDGSARELVGWCPIFLAEHDAPDNEARRHGEKGAKKKIAARYELRFGYEFIRVTEFGFDNVNAHFHGAYFGPKLDYGYDEGLLKKQQRLKCWGRLVEIFKEETRAGAYCRFPSQIVKGERWWGDYCKYPPQILGGLGVESFTVFFEPAKRGFRSVLAHALKYTEKIPASTPEGLAELEHALKGTRRVTLLGMHYGAELKVERADLKCSACDAVMSRVSGLGVVPISEIADLPDVSDGAQHENDPMREPGADEFLELGVRAP